MCETIDDIFENAYREGVELGCQMRAKEIAESMLKDEVAIELVSKCCDLPLEEVKKMKEGLKN